MLIIWIDRFSQKLTNVEKPFIKKFFRLTKLNHYQLTILIFGEENVKMSSIVFTKLPIFSLTPGTGFPTVENLLNLKK